LLALQASITRDDPAEVLATNFGQRAELMEKFPKCDVFLNGKDGPGK
jgi:hypothetical protein